MKRKFLIITFIAIGFAVSFTVCKKEPISMVFVKGGTFTMGSTDSVADPDEQPLHQVVLNDFYIGKYEITQTEWMAVMGENPSRFKLDGRNRPVEYVSWDDVQKFIVKLNAKTGKNYRLPTEAEWEYAALGGNKSKGYKYSGSDDLRKVAWYDDGIYTYNHRTQPVGTKKPNELGIYDMSGNVYEWCNDFYGLYTASLQNNPKGASSDSDRVFRGGSWINHGSYCRVSNRGSTKPSNRSYFVGFRLVRSPQ